MAFEERTLTCVDCGQPFTFSAEEQSFYAEKGFTNDPKRCSNCRGARRERRSGGDYGYSGGSSFGGAPRQSSQAICAECGKETTVPFVPRGDRPVYCSDCFSRRRGATGSGSGGGRGRY